MKRILLLLFAYFMIGATLNAQQTSLTVDCQNPGWLSNLIPYGDQQTIKDLKVTGYINGTDLDLILNMNKKFSLNGTIDLEDAYIVAGGGIEEDNYTYRYHLTAPYVSSTLRKLILPKYLISPNCIFTHYKTQIDSLFWTSTKDLYISKGDVTPLYISQITNGSSLVKYFHIPEGIQKLRSLPSNMKIVFPSSVNYYKKVGVGVGNNLTIYSYIENPQSLTIDRTGTEGEELITNTKFYIPKGTLANYKKSAFSNTKYKNTFIEYYDIDSTIINSTMITLYKGETDSIKTTIYPDAELVSWIDYYNNNPSVATVNSNGEITALEYGQTEITVSPHVFIDGLETKTATCIINVVEHTEGIEMDQTMSVHINETKKVNAYTLPLGTSDNQIIYSSSNENVATVNENGEITGVNKGTCVVTAKSMDGDYMAECQVTVIRKVDNVSIEKHKLSLNNGADEQLIVNITPSDADNIKVLWSSSDEAVATVDASGMVTAVNPGEAWIKAISDDNPEACDSCKVTVTQSVTDIELDITECTLNKIGQTVQLIATVLPENASNKNVNWKSSNESVCIVSNGKVVAVGFGTAVVIATTEEGGYMAICTVTVEEETAALKGDVNLDGKVDISDVVAVINTMAGDTTFKATSDVNNDGKTDISDVVSVINIMAGSSE